MNIENKNTNPYRIGSSEKNNKKLLIMTGLIVLTIAVEIFGFISLEYTKKHPSSPWRARRTQFKTILMMVMVPVGISVYLLTNKD